MTSRPPLCALARLLRPARPPPARAAARAVSRSCDGETKPEPPPCRPQRRPACRPPPPCSTERALRVVCCAPPRRHGPPCPTRPQPPPLTCADTRGEAACGSRPPRGDHCGAGQDAVARRLAAAADARRAHYEREARELAEMCRLTPERVPYAPGAERDCVPATDGRTYALPCAPRRTARCGPGRAPPPPEVVTRPSDGACRASAHPDPCAHRPRVFLEVDRETSTPPPEPPAPVPLPSPTPPCGCAPAEPSRSGLASRIVAGLRGQASPPRRELHTSAARGFACKTTVAGAATDLDRVLRERDSLKEAGRGRVTLPFGNGGGACGSGGNGAAGRLELPIPAGAELVRVQVSLSPSTPPSLVECGASAAHCMAPTTSGTRRDSWLSIKSIQQKLTGCGREKEPAKGPPGGPCTPRTPPPAAPTPCPAVPKPTTTKTPKSSCERGPVPAKGSKVKRCFASLPALI